MYIISYLHFTWYNASHIYTVYWLALSRSLLAWNRSWSRIYDRQSVCQSVLVLGSHLGPSCGFLGVGRPLWREDGSAIYCCCWASPVQSLLSLSPTGLKTIFYCPVGPCGKASGWMQHITLLTELPLSCHADRTENTLSCVVYLVGV
jgi:hypothetical protein